jgi:hypothetical protein
MSALSAIGAGSGAAAAHSVMDDTPARYPELAGAVTLEQLLAIASAERIAVAAPEGYSERVGRVVVAYQLARAWIDRAVRVDGRPPAEPCDEQQLALAAGVLQLPIGVVEAVVLAIQRA